MNQGEVRWCEFEAPDHGRPAVILTRNGSIPALNAVTIAPITTKLLAVDSRASLGESDGLREASEINLHNIQTISKRKVGAWIATLSDERMREINAAISYALGFDRYE